MTNRIETAKDWIARWWKILLVIGVAFYLVWGVKPDQWETLAFKVLQTTVGFVVGLMADHLLYWKLKGIDTRDTRDSVTACRILSRAICGVGGAVCVSIGL